jgi:hypothetical protein
MHVWLMALLAILGSWGAAYVSLDDADHLGGPQVRAMDGGIIPPPDVAVHAMDGGIIPPPKP